MFSEFLFGIVLFFEIRDFFLFEFVEYIRKFNGFEVGTFFINIFSVLIVNIFCRI